MRIAAAALPILLAAAVAHADPPPVEPLTDAISAPTLDEATEAAIRADDTCHPHCAFAVDHALVLPNGLRAAIRHQTNTTFDATGYIITFATDDRTFVWSTADTSEFRNAAVGVIAESSGMGKSLNQKLARIDVGTSKSILWVRFVVESSLTHFNDPPSHPASTMTTHLEYMVACRYTSATPACTAVTPVSHYDDTFIVVTGPATVKRNTETIAIR